MALQTTATKVWYKSKTIWFGFMTAVIAALVEFEAVLQGVDAVPAWLVGLIGGVIVLLRMVTKEPISSTDDTSAM